MARFRADSRVTLDFESLDAVLPSMTSKGPDGRADWLPPLPEEPSITATAGDMIEEIIYFDMDSTAIASHQKHHQEQTVLASPSSVSSCPSILVLGAERDFIVDLEGVQETAQFLGVQPVIVSEAYHDVMLGPKWRLSADIIAKWLVEIS
jgi:hypothetical protein